MTAVSALCFPADVSRCVAERKYTQEQARKELQQVFIPECNDDGTYSQVKTAPEPWEGQRWGPELEGGDSQGRSGKPPFTQWSVRPPTPGLTFTSRRV